MSAQAPGFEPAGTGLSPLDPRWQPDGDVLAALDGIDDSAASPAVVPRFTPHPQMVRRPMFEENRAVLENLRDSVEAPQSSFTPIRKPGASLQGEPAKWEPPLPLAELARARDGLVGLDGPAAAGEEPRYPSVFAVTEAVRSGTGAEAVPAASPAPAPAPRWPEGVVRGFLIAGLWDAACWHGGLDPDSCADCDAGNELCGFHAPRQMKALEYEDLHDFAAASPSDAAALNAVVISIRTGRADLADIAGRGSPLEALLLVRLQQTLGSSPGTRLAEERR